MPRNDRVEIIKKLEGELGMPVLAYVTGDRQNLDTQISFDQLPYFPRHLAAIGEQEAIALLLYTRGGHINMPWPLVNFIRAYAEKFVVLVPFFAHSAGTLICLGADEIYMSKLATLSPIDPSVANEFNPQDPVNPQNRIRIAVEDVMAYFQLAKAKGVKRDEDVAATFRRLAEAVHPLALGNVQRSIDMIRGLAEKLIRLRTDVMTGEQALSTDDISEMIERLTTHFYTHYHLISRAEAEDLKLPVVTPTAAVEGLLLDYYAQLVADLQLTEKFDPGKLFRQSQVTALTAATPGGPPATGATAAAPATFRFEQAYIETGSTADVFVAEGTASLQTQHQVVGGVPTVQQTPTFEVTKQEWERTA